MTDKNNRTMKTGDVVEITGAYFKNDNGLYFVEHTPGDPNWSGRDHCLRRIKRNGELSTAKDNICFWPIHAFVNSRDKRAAANQWNQEHAEIEIKTFPNTAHIAKFFAAEADSLNATIKRYTWDFGEDCQTVKDAKETQAFYRSVADGLRTEQRLAELDRREQQAAEPQTGTAFDGGQIVRNIDLNRLQILFDAIPDADTRAALKQNGFRWSPKNQAWQRQLTDNAERAARQVLCLA